jgi:hypothetical protein
MKDRDGRAGRLGVRHLLRDHRGRLDAPRLHKGIFRPRGEERDGASVVGPDRRVARVAIDAPGVEPVLRADDAERLAHLAAIDRVGRQVAVIDGARLERRERRLP